MEEAKVFTKILDVAIDAFLGVAGVALGVALGAFLGIAGVASGNGDKPTKFTLRVENITKPDAFTASNGVKWSLAFSPGAAIVHTEKAPVFTAGNKDRGKGLEAQAEDGDPKHARQVAARWKGNQVGRGLQHAKWVPAPQVRSLQAQPMS
jgi:hypothetical protein